MITLSCQPGLDFMHINNEFDLQTKRPGRGNQRLQLVTCMGMRMI